MKEVNLQVFFFLFFFMDLENDVGICFHGVKWIMWSSQHAVSVSRLEII